MLRLTESEGAKEYNFIKFKEQFGKLDLIYPRSLHIELAQRIQEMTFLRLCKGCCKPHRSLWPSSWLYMTELYKPKCSRQWEALLAYNVLIDILNGNVDNMYSIGTTCVYISICTICVYIKYRYYMCIHVYVYLYTLIHHLKILFRITFSMLFS